MFRKLLVLAPMLAFFNVTSVLAQSTQSLSAVPTNWRWQEFMQTSSGGGIAIFYTGSPCGGSAQSLYVNANATESFKNRLFSTIMLAKTTSKQVSITYTLVNSSACVIQGYSLQ